MCVLFCSTQSRVLTLLCAPVLPSLPHQQVGQEVLYNQQDDDMKSH
jgi:hypothetical protein